MWSKHSRRIDPISRSEGQAFGIRSGAISMCDNLFMPKQHDPGGKVRIALTLDVKGKAVFGGPGDCYRYRLSRTWDEKKPHAMFVMMNPSTADPLVDDPTVAKCGRFARAWGYGGIYVGNTFAYRATDKKHLRLVDDPTGPDNDEHLIAMAKASRIVIFAYGQPGHRTLATRGRIVARLLMRKVGIVPHVLKLSKDGIPSHPLYSMWVILDQSESLRPYVSRCLVLREKPNRMPPRKMLKRSAHWIRESLALGLTILRRLARTRIGNFYLPAKQSTCGCGQTGPYGITGDALSNWVHIVHSIADFPPVVAALFPA
jgi:hypothetical protein